MSTETGSPPNTDPTLTREEITDPAAEVARLMEKGINGTPYAWHGTSVEAVLHLAEHGELPATGSYGSEFYFAPEELDPGAQEEVGRMYAGWNGTKQYVLENLGFVPKDMELFMYAMDYHTGDDPFAKFMVEASGYGFTAQQVEDLIRDGDEQRHGVLLGLSPDIASLPDITDQGPEQRSVHFGEGGLPLGLITGIEPLGDYEWNRLLELQEAVKNRNTSSDEVVTGT